MRLPQKSAGSCKFIFLAPASVPAVTGERQAGRRAPSASGRSATVTGSRSPASARASASRRAATVSGPRGDRHANPKFAFQTKLCRGLRSCTSLYTARDGSLDRLVCFHQYNTEHTLMPSYHQDKMKVLHLSTDTKQPTYPAELFVPCKCCWTLSPGIQLQPRFKVTRIKHTMLSGLRSSTAGLGVEISPDSFEHPAASTIRSRCTLRLLEPHFLDSFELLGCVAYSLKLRLWVRAPCS